MAIMDEMLGGVPEIAVAALRDQLGTLIVNSMRELVTNVDTEEVRTFAIQMAHSATVAALRGDTEWLKEVRGQVDLMLEINRIKITKKNRKVLMGFLHGILEAVLKTALTVGANYVIGNANNIVGRIKA